MSWHETERRRDWRRRPRVEGLEGRELMAVTMKDVLVTSYQSTMVQPTTAEQPPLIGITASVRPAEFIIL
jgi:hypothetical protein